jgi:hypothetical protein
MIIELYKITDKQLQKLIGAPKSVKKRSRDESIDSDSGPSESNVESAKRHQPESGSDTETEEDGDKPVHQTTSTKIPPDDLYVMDFAVVSITGICGWLTSSFSNSNCMLERIILLRVLELPHATGTQNQTQGDSRLLEAICQDTKGAIITLRAYRSVAYILDDPPLGKQCNIENLKATTSAGKRREYLVCDATKFKVLDKKTSKLAHLTGLGELHAGQKGISM